MNPPRLPGYVLVRVQNSVGARSSLKSTSHSEHWAALLPVLSLLAVGGLNAQVSFAFPSSGLCPTNPRRHSQRYLLLLLHQHRSRAVLQLLLAVGKDKHSVQGHCPSQGDFAARLVSAFAQSTKRVPVGGRDRVKLCRCWSETRILDPVCFIWDSMCCCWPVDQLHSSGVSADPASSAGSWASPSSQTRGVELN